MGRKDDGDGRMWWQTCLIIVVALVVGGIVLNTLLGWYSWYVPDRVPVCAFRPLIRNTMKGGCHGFRLRLELPKRRSHYVECVKQNPTRSRATIEVRVAMTPETSMESEPWRRVPDGLGLTGEANDGEGTWTFQCDRDLDLVVALCVETFERCWDVGETGWPKVRQRGNVQTWGKDDEGEIPWVDDM